MSFLEKLNQFVKPLRRAMINSPLHGLLNAKVVAVSFTNQQSGETVSTSAEYIRADNVVYLFFDMDDNIWKNLAGGIPVDLELDGMHCSGWAEDLTGYDEFFRLLAKSPDKQADMLQQYDDLKEEKDLYVLDNLKEFLNENKLIRVKISRSA